MVKRISSEIKSFLTLGASNFIAGGINSIFWIYLASVVEKESYGELGFFMSIATVGGAIAAMGLARTRIVYGAKNEDIFSSTYALGLLSSSVVSVAVYILVQKISISFLIFGMMFFLLDQSELNSKKRYNDVSKYKILHSTLVVIFAIILYQFFEIDGIILGYALSNLPAVRAFYVFLKTKKINMATLKPKIGFMLNSWITVLFTTLFFWGDKIIIGPLFGFSTLANYHLASQYFILLYNFPLAVWSYLLPHEAQGVGNKKIKILSITIAGILVLISIIVVPYAIGTFFPVFHESILPIQIMSFGIIPITISLIQESKFIGNESDRIVLLGSITGVVTYFSLLVILGVSFGLVGMSAAFLLSAIIRMIFNLCASKFRT